MDVLDKYAIAQMLREIAFVIEMTDEAPKKSLAYRRAANIVESMEDFNKIIADKALETFPGIGKVTAKMITTLYYKRPLPYYHTLMQKIPSSLIQLTLIPGLGLQRIKLLFENFHVTSINELETILKNEEIKIKGFGSVYTKKILKNISMLVEEGYAMSYPKALALANIWINILSEFTEKIEITGALRRKSELLHEIELVAIPKNLKICLEKFKKHYLVKSILQDDNLQVIIVLKQGAKVILNICSEENFQFSLLHTTGNKIHFSELQKVAIEKNYRLEPFSLFSEKDVPLKIITESDVYNLLQLPFIPPELREGYGEIQASKKGSFAHLIEEQDLRGTFHCHTTYSDGGNTLEEMAAAAYQLGWEYIGISDHSKSCAIANGMSEETLFNQIQKISSLNKQYSDASFRIFSGIECDILKDGNLDYSNEILKELDFVIVSIHRHFGLEEDVMTQRLIKAIENPYTTMIGHLTGRLLGHRPGYQLNMPKIFDACVANDKIIELNAYPSRLDMDWRLWIKSKVKGIKCCINPDAHSVQDLHNCLYGVNIARKGWLSKDDVINTMSLKDIQAFLISKRY